MAVILHNSIFVHISKTGGTWVTAALENAGLITGFYGAKHYNVEEIVRTKPEFKNKAFFAFVRNPVTWYQSRWACNFNRKFFMKPHQPRAKETKKLVEHSKILNRQEFKNFNIWAYRVLTKEPGWLSSHYNNYIADVQYVGKYENLADDLIDILTKIGEPVHRKLIRDTSIENESNKNLSRLWDSCLLEKVLKHEREFMERFEYPINIDNYGDICLK